MAAAKNNHNNTKHRVPTFGDPSTASKTLVVLLIVTAVILLVPLTNILVN